MADEEDIEVQILPDDQPTTEQAPVVEKAVVEKEEKKPAEIVQAKVAEYEERIEAERRAKDEATARAEAAERNAEAARKQASMGELEIVTNAIATTEMKLTAIKRQLQDAMQSGDFEATIKANEELASSTYDLRSLKEGKAAIESRKPEPAADERLRGYSRRSQQYLSAHPELLSDQRKHARMLAAHHDSVAEGIQPDSDAYYAFIDERLGYSTAKPETKTPAPKPVRPAGAPISRGQDVSSGASSVVKLTPGEARAATDGTILWNSGPNKGQPIGIKEYARRKVAMIAENRYADAS